MNDRSRELHTVWMP